MKIFGLRAKAVVLVWEFLKLSKRLCIRYIVKHYGKVVSKAPNLSFVSASDILPNSFYLS